MCLIIEHQEIITKKYYDIFLKFLNMVGWHQASIKRLANSRKGVYIVQKVMRDAGQVGAAADKTIDDYDKSRRDLLNELNH